jgi:transcription elongation factor GreA
MTNDTKNTQVNNGNKAPIELTNEGLQELKEELKELKEVKLPEAIKRVTAAREYGDLSENAEYHDARDEQEFIHTRIDDIEEIIANAKVVKGTRSQTVIGIGSTVTVKKNDSKTKQEFQIVGEYEADPMENKISSASPLGKALIGKRQGDEVSVKAPAGTTTYTIVKIK